MSTMKRVKPNREEERKLYVRSGGRCAICQAYLLEGSISGEALNIGEMAHIVGATDAPKSPRGKSNLSAKDRAKAENLILLCQGEHQEIDSANSEWATVEKLYSIKESHESWIRHVTGLERGQKTAVVRMIGNVREECISISRSDASNVVLTSGNRYPSFPLSSENYGFEIDLRSLPEDSWEEASKIIERRVKHQLYDSLAPGEVNHVSLFAFARIPILVKLGAALNDTFAVDIYSANRSTGAWDWPATTRTADFSIQEPSRVQSEAVLLLNISGSVDTEAIPAKLKSLPQWKLSLTSKVPHRDALKSREDLAVFSLKLKELFSEVEAKSRLTKRFHVFSAIPLSAAVELGRVHDTHVNPSLAIYELTNKLYHYALEI